ncbi:MAG: hypothetical protein K2G37_05025 [Clostridia bacterium]|nr:hypothetical protein [Clostridia bacterium]MDE7328582.1 hypothetical protein [Clostridia bacterium]
MKIYELFSIYIIGAAFGIIFRYILGYKRRHIPFVTANILFGGLECIISYFFTGADCFKIFLSGVGGILFDFAYCLCRLTFCL